MPRERAGATDSRERNRTCEDEWSLERLRGTMRDRESREEKKKKATEAGLGLKGGDVTSD